jgi:DNA-binding winged helix-turn-helix (wHTH) protein
MVPATAPVRFGIFELDVQAGELRKDGAPVRLPPQPYKLLVLLASRPGQIVTRQEIQNALWGDGTNVDFEQGVNFSVKQVREALGDDADEPRYVQTVPKRGYRFIAPVQTSRRGMLRGMTEINLHKALWANIAEMRLAEQRRRRLLTLLAGVVAVLLVVLLIILKR